MNVTLLLSGDELIDGRIRDANGAFLARRLHERGHDVDRIEIVGDDLDDLVECLRESRERADAVVMSGGLGSTGDDLTRHALAEAFSRDLRLDDQAVAWIASFWERVGREAPVQPYPEAFLPAGTRALPNPVGLAPGIALEEGPFRVVALPGVPSELRGMVEAGVLDVLGEGKGARVERTVHAMGLAESEAAVRLGALLERGRQPLIGITCGQGRLTLRVQAESDDPDVARRLVEDGVRAIRERLGAHVFGEGEVSLAEVVLEQLRRRGATLAVAESLTGGEIGHLITEVPGASDVFLADFVCYANEAKEALLGVPGATLRAHGAVSLETAVAMARGARERTGADFAVSTTGIAGPTGGSAEKPVGLVWTAVAWAGGERTLRRVHAGSRHDVKQKAAHQGLDLLRRTLAESAEMDGGA
ncbi:MAG TPA: CinA family nicotinamide mononucleotide deamidase-related protein [Planctomycetes bacterium]|nr:CinA family nicotinamide mononucleotide deamidase-related protein [Planctomycetota bacterium]